MTRAALALLMLLVLRLVAYIAAQRDLLAPGTLDDAALYAVRRQLGDLRQCAEALGVGL